MNKLLALLFYVAAAFLFSLPIAAQPGDETRRYQETVAKLKALDEKIAQNPNDADPHFQRASIYLGLFRIHAVAAEYGGVVYVNDPGGKALPDLNRAIEIDQTKGEYYTGRGKFYDFQWGHAVSRGAEAAGSSWEKTRLLLWENRSFDSAVKDYQKALSIARTGSEMSHPLHLLSWLHRARAMSAAFSSPAKTVLAEKQTRLVFDDFDRSLEFTRKYLALSALSEFLLRDIYFDKARAAIEFEEYTAGIKFLSDGIREIQERQISTEGLCSLYALRGDISQKLKDYDTAIRDYTYPIDHKYPNCNLIREKRGDALSAKGEWQRAIEDYSSELTKYSYAHVSLLTRRAKAYLKIGDPEKALADLGAAMTFHKSCSKQYQLRAEAYRMLNEESRAAEDEKTAIQLSRNKLGCSL